MAVFLADGCTDADNTSLADHAPDVGGAWEALGFASVNAGAVEDLIISSNTLIGAGSAVGTFYRNSADPGSDEYDITATFVFGPGALNRAHGLAWRMTPTGTASAAVDRYVLIANVVDDLWSLWKVVAGTSTMLDSSAQVLDNSTHDVRVEVRTGGMTVLVDDVAILTSNDTDVTQVGRVGVYTARGGATHFIDDVVGDDVAAGVTGTLAAIAPAGTAQLTGTLEVTGSLAVVGPATQAAVSGTLQVTGQLAAVAPAAATALTGQLPIVGALNAVAPAAVAQLTGTTAGAITPRPNTGTTPRPTSGITVRPNIGITPRP